MTVEKSIPSHVSEASVYDFDIYNDPIFGDEVHDSLTALYKNAPDVFWTPRNGGHWVITRQAPITEIVLDPEHFSVREMQIPRVPNPPLFIPLSLDPPDSIPYRQALMPKFSPKAISVLNEKIRDWAKKFVHEVADKGECDFTTDIAEPFPVSIFMELMGMDLSRLREFRDLSDWFFSVQNDPEQLQASVGRIMEVMTGYIEEKKSQPDDGLISHLLNVNIAGRPIELPELQNMCLLLFAAGIHTVTNVSSFAYWNLSKSPELQKQLVDHPELITDFAEEAIRLYGVVNAPRIVRKDCEKLGVKFKKDEMVLCMLPLAGRDENVNADGNKFKLERKGREYVTFSKGPHLCVGHVLARTEIKILTEEWLKHVPSFSLKKGSIQDYHTSTTYALHHVPLTWQ
jgi:cytochrome P450